MPLRVQGQRLRIKLPSKTAYLVTIIDYSDFN